MQQIKAMLDILDKYFGHLFISLYGGAYIIYEHSVE
jgi:hypothetical protein